MYASTYLSRLGVVLILALLLAACSAPEAPVVEPEAPEPVVEEPTPEPEVVEEKILTIGIPSDVETIDPSFGAAERANETIKNIYDQPVRYTREMTDEGYMVANINAFDGIVWESFELQDDEVTWEIRVRPGIRFQETGNEITAETIRYKLERAFGIGASDQWVFNTAGVYRLDQVEVTGEYDLTITLDAPNPLFLPLMRDQDAGIVDPELVEANATEDDPWATEWMANHYAGSGPFYVESWTPGVEVVLAANEDYWEGKACFDKVSLKIIPDSTSRALLLSQGAIDIAANLSVDEMESLRGAPGVEILSIPSRNVVMLGLNNKMEPFDNVTVRQALAYAVPYEQIVQEVFYGQGDVPTSSWASRAQFHDPNHWPYEYNPEMARALLEEAGYSDGFSFSLSILTGDSEMEGVAVILQNTFREIGVDMEIQRQAAAVYFERLWGREHQAFMRTALDYVDDPFYRLFLWFKTDTVINWFDYSNERIDEITDEMATELDPDRRTELASEAQQIINEESPVLWVAELNYMLAKRDDITGFVLEPDHLLSYYELCRE